jgi:CcmD family protein
MEGLEYLFAAFAIIWLGFFIYLFVLSRKQSYLQRELDSLKNSTREEK